MENYNLVSTLRRDFAVLSLLMRKNYTSVADIRERNTVSNYSSNFDEETEKRMVKCLMVLEEESFTPESEQIIISLTPLILTIRDMN